MKATLKDIEASLDDTRSALMKLGEIERGDEEFISEHFEDVQRLTAKISEAQISLTQQFKDGQKLQTDAEKALKAQQGSQEKFYQELAEFDKWINDEKKELKETFQKSDQIATKAQAAFDGRDARALADAQKAMTALNIDSVTTLYDTHGPQLKKFLQEVQDSGFDKDTVVELTKGTEDTTADHAANKTYVDLLKSQQKLVLDFELKPVDVKKAIAALDLDPKSATKLAKVLGGPRSAMEKGLDALAKEFKFKLTGKQILASLDRAGLI